MPKRRFRDLIVVIPGITGSVLERDGREVWGFSAAVGWNALRTRGGSIRGLALAGDDPEAESLGDGVRATSVIHRAHSLPGLHKNVGYGPLLHTLREQLGVAPDSGHEVGNLAEFAYDWRRDNRASARALARFVDVRLRAWREASGASDARVVFVAHSMGGLVARYYLECLDGRRHCRALITFGTPYRGAPSALEFVCNGYKALCLDLSDAMRSFTSVYQLLPRYPMVEVNGSEPMYIDEVEELPHVDRSRARAARAFHAEIEDAVAAHKTESRYLIDPIVGMRQPTLQYARVSHGVCRVHRDIPQGWPAEWADGDGTVPRVSATPIDLSNDFRDTFIGERHAALQVHERTVTQVASKLLQLQAQGDLSRVRAAVPADPTTIPVLALDLDDAYPAGEPVVVGVQTVNYVEPFITVTAEITPLEGGTARWIVLAWRGDRYETAIEDLAPGTYAITVTSANVFPQRADPVHDLFEIIPRE